MTTHTLDGLVRRVRLHAELGKPEERALLALPFTTVSRDPYSYILREGDRTEHCFVLLSGIVERHRLDSDGGKQILAFYIPGDPLNLDHLYLDVADDDLRTLRASEIALIRMTDLRMLMQEVPGIGQALLRILAIDSSVFREWTVNVGQRDAEKRIAHLLCELEVRTTSQVHELDGSRLPVTQYNIAEATGLTPVHVNRTLKSLQAHGLLSANRGGIRVHDWQRLREVSGFDYRYLHMLAHRDKA